MTNSFTESRDQLVEMTKALKSIAESLEKIANPPKVVKPKPAKYEVP